MYNVNLYPSQNHRKLSSNGEVQAFWESRASIMIILVMGCTCNQMVGQMLMIDEDFEGPEVF